MAKQHYLWLHMRGNSPNTNQNIIISFKNFHLILIQLVSNKYVHQHFVAF